MWSVGAASCGLGRGLAAVTVRVAGWGRGPPAVSTNTGAPGRVTHPLTPVGASVDDAAAQYQLAQAQPDGRVLLFLLTLPARRSASPTLCALRLLLQLLLIRYVDPVTATRTRPTTTGMTKPRTDTAS